MPFGINDLKNVIRIPVNWDLAYMRQWQTADGVTWDRIVARMGAALSLFNRSLTSGVWGSFIRTTTDLGVEYAISGENDELPPMPEHNRPDLFAGEAGGHMIPMRDYGGGLGWTSLALRRATANKMDLSIQAIIDRGRVTWERRILERMFKSNVVRVGAGGVSLPFADGGVGDSEYIPVPSGGYEFDATHNHYFRETDDASGRSAALIAMATALREHGHTPPYTLVIPEADVAVWAAQDEYTPPANAILQTVGLERRAVNVDTSLYTGVFEVDRAWGFIMPTSRVPANYAGMFKPYGFGSASNPIAIRYEPGYPLGLTIEGQVVIYPLQEAVAMFTFGAGVNDRTNGALTYFAANGDYVDPDIA
jgi:hypothetical protein